MKYFKLLFHWILLIMVFRILKKPASAAPSKWDPDQIDQFIQTQIQTARIPWESE